MVEEFKKQEGLDLATDKQAMQRIRDAAEKAKIELSGKTESEVNIPYITADAGGPKHLLVKVTRAQFEQMTDELIDKTFKAVKSALKDAKLEPNQIDEVILVGGQTRMPRVVEKVKEQFGKDPHKGVNPDEVVAMGAAIQGGVLTGESKDVLLLDVTPLTLGLETLGSVRTPLIDRNTTVPTSKTQTFSTAADNQTSVEINVLQGEREMAADNKSLGRFILDGIPPAPRGMPQIDVTFDIDSNGILNVSAKDKASGKEQKITITGSTGLGKDEVSRMVDEAKVHEAEDKEKRETAETRNIAESLAFTAEKSIKDAGDKLEPAVKSEVEGKIATLRDSLKGTDNADIKAKTDELSSSLSKIGEAMNAQQETPSAGGEQPTSEEAQTGSEPQGENPDVAEGEVVEE